MLMLQVDRVDYFSQLFRRRTKQLPLAFGSRDKTHVNTFLRAVSLSFSFALRLSRRFWLSLLVQHDKNKGYRQCFPMDKCIKNLPFLLTENSGFAISMPWFLACLRNVKECYHVPLLSWHHFSRQQQL